MWWIWACSQRCVVHVIFGSTFQYSWYGRFSLKFRHHIKFSNSVRAMRAINNCCPFANRIFGPIEIGAFFTLLFHLGSNRRRWSFLPWPYSLGPLCHSSAYAAKIDTKKAHIACCVPYMCANSVYSPYNAKIDLYSQSMEMIKFRDKIPFAVLCFQYQPDAEVVCAKCAKHAFEMNSDS